MAHRTDDEFLIELTKRAGIHWPTAHVHLPDWLRVIVPAALPKDILKLVVALLWHGPSHGMWSTAMLMARGLKPEHLGKAAKAAGIDLSGSTDPEGSAP